MTEPDVGFRRAHASALPVTGAWRPGDPELVFGLLGPGR